MHTSCRSNKSNSVSNALVTKSKIVVIIPAKNEAKAIGHVLDDLPKGIKQVIVVDNASSDDTAAVARNHGAFVLEEPRSGYGYACKKAMLHLSQKQESQPEERPDIVVFLDGDYSDYPEYLEALVTPIIANECDLVIGARQSELMEKGAMTLPQRFGNWLATFLMRHLFKATYTDLGPFRAIDYQALMALNMVDNTYGWTIEMQLKALKHKLRYQEIPVPYRNRIGVSKVSGTIKGVVMAGIKILGWIGKYALKS